MLETAEWSKTVVHGKPAGRYNHAAAVVDSNMWVFGGCVDGRLVNEMYVFEFEKSAWSKVETIGIAPAPRDRHSMTFIQVQNKQLLYVFGGHSLEHDV